MVKIATWNVNSIKARLPNALEWLASASPDVVLLQETKVIDDQFPRMEIEDLGYNIATHGQRTYNGVAILSKSPIEVEQRGLPGYAEDEQARYIEAVIGDLRIASIYLPNGNPAPGEKFDYKLRWMAHLHDHVRSLLEFEEAVVLGGDYNVVPADGDVFDPAGWADDALCRPESRAAFRKIQWLGYTEAYRALHRDVGVYTWWDYRAGQWARDHGARIDHFLLSPQAADRLVSCTVDREPRGKEKASDHTPVICEISA